MHYLGYSSSASDGFLIGRTAGNEQNWGVQFGGATASFLWYGSAVVDSASNVYVTGEAVGSLPGSTAESARDNFIVKFDRYGHMLWSVQFGTGGSDLGGDLGSGITVDGEDNVVAVGMWGDDVFVSKYDSSGTLLWREVVGGAAADSAGGVAATAAGAIYVSITTAGSFGDGVNLGGMDGVVVKFGPGGDMLWSVQYGTAGSDISRGIAVDSGGNVVVCGTTSGAFPGFTNAAGADIYLAKLDANGTTVWVQQLVQINYDQYVKNVAVDGDSNIYVVGDVGNDCYFRCGLGLRDAILVKYDSSGALQWLRKSGGNTDDIGVDVAVDNLNGFVYLVGTTYNGGSFEGLPSHGGSDAVVYQYSLDGDMLSAVQVGTVGDDAGVSIAVDVAGAAVYLVGTTSSEFFSLRDGISDVFIQKYSLDWKQQWAHEAASGGDDYIMSSTTDPDGNIFYCGYSSGVSGVTGVLLRKLSAFGTVLWTSSWSGLADGPLAGVAFSAADQALYTCQSSESGSAFVYRVSPVDGSVVWSTELSTSTGNETVSGVFALDGGGVIVAGSTSGSFGASIPSHGEGSCFLSRLDASGSVLWVRQYDLDECGAAAVSTSTLYATGSVDGDVFVGSFSAVDGSVEWNSTVGSTGLVSGGVDIGVSVCADSMGNVYCVGRTNGIDFAGSSSSGKYVDTDRMFIVSLNSSGSLRWSELIGSYEHSAIGGAVVVDEHDSVYAVGIVRSGEAHRAACGIFKYDFNGNRQWYLPIAGAGAGAGVESVGGLSVDSENALLISVATASGLMGLGGAGGVDSLLYKYGPTLLEPAPTGAPTGQPTRPSGYPTGMPTCPTGVPTGQPSGSPISPSRQPTEQPSGCPSATPSSSCPTSEPSFAPTSSCPTGQPSEEPSSSAPTGAPSGCPSSSSPSSQPTSSCPTGQPSEEPSSSAPTGAPSGCPSSSSPSSEPSREPTSSCPTGRPTGSPTEEPRVVIDNPYTGSYGYFGAAVSVLGDLILVGAPHLDSFQGACASSRPPPLSLLTYFCAVFVWCNRSRFFV